MNTVFDTKIPEVMKAQPNWVLWKLVLRGDKLDKLPFQVNGSNARSNDATTWTTFDNVWQAFQNGGYEGIGFMFPEDRQMCGIDLDGCRDPQTGNVEAWARHVIEKFGTYAEVSPSGTGVKLFCVGKSPFDTGKKKMLEKETRITDKTPAIEVYDHIRYFAVTGRRLRGMPSDPQPTQEKINWLTELYWPKPKPVEPAPCRVGSTVIDRARKYLAKLPPAISGQDGHGATFRAACVLVLGFGLSESEAFGLLKEYNANCQPPWSDRELAHKVKSAANQPGERNYLRDTRQDQWDSIKVPAYEEALRQPEQPTKRQPSIITLDKAAANYLDELRAGPKDLIRFGLPEVEAAIGGGIELGEMVVVAALPSHGKSAVALQCAHAWTYSGMPCFMVSEEMTPRLLGKRALQFISGIPQSDWHRDLETVERELHFYTTPRAPCFIADACGETDIAIEQIERAVKEHGVKCAIVDYTQQLKSRGNNKYEQVSNTSIALKQCATRNNIIVLALAQLNKEIEKRPKFDPKLSDLADSSQIGKDADVILFLCWPWKLDSGRDKQEYWFFVGKNRNREIKEWSVKCKFYADRQTVVDVPPPPPKNYEHAFDTYNRGDAFE